MDIVADLLRRHVRLNWYAYRHRGEQGSGKNGALINIFRMVGQAGYGEFAQSLQPIRLSKRSRSILQFFAHSRTLRLGKISRIRHTAEGDSGISVNRHQRSIGKHQLIERYVRRFRRSKVAIEESSGALAHPHGPNSINMSLDR